MSMASRKKITLLTAAALVVLGTGLMLVFGDRLYAMLAGESTTLGVVRDITEPSTNPALPQLATVRLQDGSVIEASLPPACNVVPGDHVRVRVLDPLGGEKKLFTVVGRVGKQI